MAEKQNTLHKMLGLMAVIILVFSLFGPMIVVGENAGHMEQDMNISSEDDWVIDGVTRYINVSRAVDSNVIVRNEGALIINDSTLTLMIDGFNPWTIRVESGGQLILQNSTIETQLTDASVLRPFLKTNVSAYDGSSIILHDSAFVFPGWVYIDNSELTMKNSEFRGLPNAAIPPTLSINDNNDCPRLTAVNDSIVLIEDSRIRDYYINRDVRYERWSPSQKGPGDTTGQPLENLLEADNIFYEIEPGQTMEIAQWFALPSLSQAITHINPTNRLKNLHIEILYQTDEGYVGGDVVLYSNSTTMKSAMTITDTNGNRVSRNHGIWEVDLSTFYRDGAYFYKDLDLRLENNDPLNRSIHVDRINLVSGYDNSINIIESELIVINSQIDIDFRRSQPCINPGVSTDHNTYMMDFNPEHRVIRLLNSGLKAYGLYPYGEEAPHIPSPDGDPPIIGDEASNNRTWIYRWVDVRPMDSSGAPLVEAEISVDMSVEYKEEVSQELYDNVMAHMDPANNPEALDYIVNNDMGGYDFGTSNYITNNDGLARIFMISDRINHPGDWPNSRFVGDYVIHVDDPDLGEKDRDISLPPFPLLTDADSIISEDIYYEEDIPLPDLAVTAADIHFRVDGEPVSIVRNDTLVDITADVVNQGTLIAEDVVVNFYLVDGQNVELIGSDTITADVGVTEEANIQWTSVIHPEGQIGYYIRVHVNPDQYPMERSYDNNIAERFIYVLELPDLIPVYFTVNPDEIYAGKTLNMETRVENIGLWESAPTRVSFYVDHGTQYESLIAVRNLPSLESGETSGIISATWTASLVESPLNETRVITVRVNYPMLEENEENTANNWANQTIEVMNPADLSVSPDDVVFGEVLPQVGQELEITATVYNYGGEEVTTTVEFYDGDIFIDEVPVTIGSLEHEDVTVLWTPTIRGYREITVYAVPDDFEINTDNNIAQLTQAVFNEGFQGDIVVRGTESITIGTLTMSGFVMVMENGHLTIEDEAVRANFQINQDMANQYGIIVMDNGRLDIGNALLHSDNELSIRLHDQGVVRIMENSIIYSMINIRSMDESILTVRDSTIEGSMHLEGSEFNAYGSSFDSTAIYISPSNIVGVNSTFSGSLDTFRDTVGSLTAVTTPNIGMTGDSMIEIYCWWRINTVSYGDIPISGSQVSIVERFVDDGYQYSGVTDRDGVIYIPARILIITPTQTSYVGSYLISASYSEKGLDFEVAQEPVSLPTDEHVVTRTLTFTELKLPDISISDDDVYTDVSVVTSGDPVNIYADVSNIGHEDARNVSVEFYLQLPDDEEILIGYYNISVIRVGRVVVASIPWTSEMIEDDILLEERSIRIWANPDTDPLSDANLANNEAWVDISVRSPPLLEFEQETISLTIDGAPIEDDTVMERDTMVLSIDAVNRGGTDIYNASIEINYSEGNIAREIVDMPIGEVITISESWLIDVRGPQTITIWVNSSREDPRYSVSISRQITVQPMQMVFSGLPRISDIDMGETLWIEGILERGDGIPLGGMTVYLYLNDGNNETIRETSASTDPEGRFSASLLMPERTGRFSIWVRPDHPEGEYVRVDSFRVIGEDVSAIPWWVILVVVIAAAGSVGGVILYLKYKGEGEWVECGSCGATIPSDSTECPKCGTQFEMDTVKCSECGEWIPASSIDCPSCGAEFITTGVAIEEYKETMEKQYGKYVNRQKLKAKKALRKKDLSEEEFMEWWEKQPGYMTFDEWLEQEEERRRRGGIECKECGSTNPADEAICQKCGSSLIQVDPSIRKEAAERKKMKPQEDEETLDLEDDILGLDEELEEDPKPMKKVKKSPRKVTKKVKKVKK